MTSSNKAKLQQLKTAFLRAIDRAGNVHRLHLQTSVSEASLNRYRSGRQDIANAPFFTLLQMFPELELRYFAPKTAAKGETQLETQLLTMFRALNRDEQLACLKRIAADLPGMELPADLK
ncbi:MAG: hypothetical protein IJJ28_05445 [Lentisphaeria bacterium]|nr:hypothetical protein [Lentisphaeria bacterium]